MKVGRNWENSWRRWGGIKQSDEHSATSSSNKVLVIAELFEIEELWMREDSLEFSKLMSQVEKALLPVIEESSIERVPSLETIPTPDERAKLSLIEQ